MRIGIITYHFANNYGAVLQAYCLQKVLEKTGIEIEFIDYQSKLQTSNNSIFLEKKLMSSGSAPASSIA